jgi:hypothetical protein
MNTVSRVSLFSPDKYGSYRDEHPSQKPPTQNKHSLHRAIQQTGSCPRNLNILYVQRTRDWERVYVCILETKRTETLPALAASTIRSSLESDLIVDGGSVCCVAANVRNAFTSENYID